MLPRRSGVERALCTMTRHDSPSSRPTRRTTRAGTRASSIRAMARCQPGEIAMASSSEYQRVLRLLRVRHCFGAGFSVGGVSLRRSSDRHALLVCDLLAGIVGRPWHVAVRRHRKASWPRHQTYAGAVPAGGRCGHFNPARARAGGRLSAWLLALFRLFQGIALGGTWGRLPSLLALRDQGSRGWYAMIPQLGAPLGLILASGLFGFSSPSYRLTISCDGAGATVLVALAIKWGAVCATADRRRPIPAALRASGRSPHRPSAR